jgi:hypothetical protein
MAKNNDILGSIYRNTYKQNDSHKKELEVLHLKMSQEINRTISNSRRNDGDVDISSLFDQINKDVGPMNKDSFEKIFDSDDMAQLISIYNANKFIKEADREVDTILHYMPALADAVDTIKNNILSVDNETQTAITITPENMDDDDDNKKINIIEDIHNTEEMAETTLHNMITYGEDFLAKFDYKDMGQFLRNTSTTRKIEIKKSELPDAPSVKNLKEEYTLDVEFCEGYGDVISSPIVKLMESSTFDEFGDLVINEAADYGNLKQQLLDEDALIDTSTGLALGDTESKLNVTGCYVKRLERYRTIPLYLENDIFNGVIYIEPKNDPFIEDTFNGFTSILNRTNTNKQLNDNIQRTNEQNKNLIFRKMADKLTKEIDVKFINNNKNLAKELYLLLKFNADNNTSLSATTGINSLKITYIKPQNVQHFFFKKDTVTNRGISLLEKSIVPGKLYTSLYIASVIGVLTRGFDKRAYYVMNEVENNVSETMINVINQIKRGNFGMREFNNIDNVINIPGRFNDMVIPVNPGGQRPIEMEIVSGQNIDIKSDLLDILENLALMPTGVPPEMVSIRQQVEFSRRLGMTNIKFFRWVTSLQSKFAKQYEKWINKIYKTYHPEDYVRLSVKISSPAYLTLQIMLDAFQSTQQMIDTMAVVEYNEADDPKEIAAYKRFMFKHLMPNTIGWDYSTKAKELAAMEYKTSKKVGEEQ